MKSTGSTLASHLQKTAHSYDRPEPIPHASRLPRLALALLILCALVMASWPVYRLRVAAPIDPNEGWNAYLADAAMGAMPLYPEPDRLVTNNYPPLSFYAVGLFGKWVGDNVLAGRLLSLAAVFIIGWAVARIVLTLGGNRFGATAGAVWFVGTMCRYFAGYVGMNDPQLLAHALMALAFARLLQAELRGESCAPAVLAMVIAGFFKHNIIAMPAAAMALLYFRRPHEFRRCALLAAGAMAAGFAICYGLYGPPFIHNFFTPRSHNWQEALWALNYTRYVVVGVVAWAALAWKGRQGDLVLHLWAAAGFVAFFLQKSGAGVDMNAQFDWVIALSAAVGLSLSRLFHASLDAHPGISRARTAALLFFWAGWWMTTQTGCFRLIFRPSFRAKIAASERVMAVAVAQARNAPGDVDSSDPLVSYRAGKPFAVDEFNAQERIRAGALPAGTISRLIETGKLTRVELPYGCP